MNLQHGTPSGGARAIATLAVLLAASLVLLTLIDRPPREKTSGRGPSATSRARASPPTVSPGRRQASPTGDRSADDENWVPAGGAAQVAIVIDDVGFDPEPTLELAALDLPLTFAILPGQPYTRTLAAHLAATGHEIILHMPMEPLTYPVRDPGQGAVSETMTPRQVGEAVRRALDELPEARGLNNHMGSRTTGDPVVMRAVLEVVRERGLYFLDSRTTPDTVGYELARRMGIPALERSVFLDDRREGSYIEGQVRSLLRKAREDGSAVAIGHADRTTAETLKRAVHLFREENVRVVPASELASRGNGESG